MVRTFVAVLLKEAEDADAAQKQKLFEQLKSELQVHEVVDHVMGQLEQLSPSDDTWDAKFSVIEENLKHHINEEEREMFEQAQKVFSDDEFEQLGDQMMRRKEQLSGA